MTPDRSQQTQHHRFSEQRLPDYTFSDLYMIPNCWFIEIKGSQTSSKKANINDVCGGGGGGMTT